jgi:hypothetical protein
MLLHFGDYCHLTCMTVPGTRDLVYVYRYILHIIQIEILGKTKSVRWNDTLWKEPGSFRFLK